MPDDQATGVAVSQDVAPTSIAPEPPCAPCEEAKRKRAAAPSSDQPSYTVRSAGIVDGNDPAAKGLVVLGGFGLTREMIEKSYEDSPEIKALLLQRLQDNSGSESAHGAYMAEAGFAVYKG